MKKCLVMLLAAALFVVAGCKKDDNNAKKMTFTSDFGGGAKTEINDHSMKWTTGDDIIVNGETFACEVKEEGVRAEFTGKVVESPYNAYYPTSIWNEGTPTLPSTQYYAENNLSRVSPMYAHSENTSLLFHNICVLVKLELKGTGTVKTITASADQSLSGEFTIAGNETDGYYANVPQLRDGAATVTLDCGEGVALDPATPEAFYIALPQGEYDNLKFTVSNGAITKEVTMEDNNLVAGKLYGIQKEVKLVADISVTGVSVSPTTLSLVVGATQQLTATVLPENATNKNVTWSSDDESVATVAADGTVTAVAAGTATITVTTEDGGKTATCVVTVTAPAPVVPEGALSDKKFTVGVDGDGNPIKVYFSKGNLYWDGDSFEIEANQCNYATSWNTNYVTHFYWSSDAAEAYGESNSDITGTGSDVFFTNITGFVANNESGWYTLSQSEWYYLLLSRTNANSLKSYYLNSAIKIENINYYGIFIYPDGYNGNAVGGEGVATWAAINEAGIVFLPYAGRRFVNTQGVVSFSTYNAFEYWSSTPDGTKNAYYLYMRQDLPVVSSQRYNGSPVRLVYSAN